MLSGQLDPVARAILHAMARRRLAQPGDAQGVTLRQLFPRRGPASRRAGEPGEPSPIPQPSPSQLLDAARALARLGLVEELPARSRAAGPRWRLTHEGLHAAGAAAPPLPLPPTAPAVARSPALETVVQRLDELLRRVEGLSGQVAALHQRLDGLERQLQLLPAGVADALAGRAAAGSSGPAAAGRTAGSRDAGAVPAVSLDQFRAWLFEALDDLDRRERLLGLVPVPRVRAALAGRVGREDFDRLVTELAVRREVSLVPHDHPSELSPQERQACLHDPALGLVYYWFRWRS